MVMAAGVHLFPFRTEKLSPPAAMVLVPQGTGRVARRQHKAFKQKQPFDKLGAVFELVFVLFSEFEGGEDLVEFFQRFAIRSTDFIMN